MPTHDVVLLSLRELTQAEAGPLMTRRAAIRAEGLTKYYGAVIGIEDLSFEVARGEVYGFLGANGAGKTTTIRLLLDLLRPTRGRATVLGIDCHRDSLAARRLIGYLPGDLPIYPDLSAGGYLAYLARLDGRPVAPATSSICSRASTSASIDQRRRLRDQSHGMKQKIGIIQALMARAPVVDPRRADRGPRPDDGAGVPRNRRRAEARAARRRCSCRRTCWRKSRRPAIGSAWSAAAASSPPARSRSEARREAARDGHFPRTRRPRARVPALPGVDVHRVVRTEWVLDVRGPIGPLVRPSRACRCTT